MLGMPRRKPNQQMPVELESFPTRLRYAREKAGLTKRALADRSGVDIGQLSRWERSERGVRITVETLLRLARALGQPVGWLAADEGHPVPVIREVTDRRRRRRDAPPPRPDGRREPSES